MKLMKVNKIYHLKLFLQLLCKTIKRVQDFQDVSCELKSTDLCIEVCYILRRWNIALFAVYMTHSNIYLLNLFAPFLSKL